MANLLAGTDELGSVLKALSDPTRRVVLERLSLGPAAASALAEPFDMALPSFLQHMDALEKSGLVRSEKHGRVRTYHLSPEPLRRAEQWLTAQRAVWERRLDQFDRFVTTLHADRTSARASTAPTSRAAGAPTRAAQPPHSTGSGVYVPGPSPFTPTPRTQTGETP